MYYCQNIVHPEFGSIQLILKHVEGGIQSFCDVESNDGPERTAYLAWLAAGNEPERAAYLAWLADGNEPEVIES